MKKILFSYLAVIFSQLVFSQTFMHGVGITMGVRDQVKKRKTGLDFLPAVGLDIMQARLNLMIIMEISFPINKQGLIRSAIWVFT